MDNESSRGYEPTPIDPFAELRERESRLLPRNYEQLTYRGRYDHVDKYVLDLVDAEHLSGDEIKILDVGAGTLEFGSPTDNDLFEAIARRGKKAKISAIDPNMPDELNPSHPEIEYLKSLESVTGQYDVVRLLRVIDWLNPEAYEALRATALAHLREGGIFVTTQEIGEWKLHKLAGEAVLKKIDACIKVSQLRNGDLTPISLRPADKLPIHTKLGQTHEQFLDWYAGFREDVLNGKQKITPEVDSEGHQRNLRRAFDINPEWLTREKLPLWDPSLDYDANDAVRRTYLIQPNQQPFDEDEMKSREAEVAAWFRKRLDAHQ